MKRIAPCLWFDSDGEEAARHYTAIFSNSKIVKITRYGDAGKEIHCRPAGSVLTVTFELDGQPFTALNGGRCSSSMKRLAAGQLRTQQEIDYYWDKLSRGGDSNAQQCGWLKDKYGLSWQVVPVALEEMLSDTVTERSERVMTALLQMKKLDIAQLKKAYSG